MYGHAGHRYLSAIVPALIVTGVLTYVMTIVVRVDRALWVDNRPFPRLQSISTVLDEFDVIVCTAHSGGWSSVPQPQARVLPTWTSMTGEHTPTWEPPVVIPVQDVRVGKLNYVDVVVLERGLPRYPRRALSRGIEGWVNLEFRIDAQGRVISPRAVDGKPRGFCDKSALEAVQRYRFLSRHVNGEGVAVEGVRRRIVYELTS